MIVEATSKRVRISPRKARLIVDQIRGKDVIAASEILRYCVHKGGKLVAKVLDSAISNAENNENAFMDDLVVKEAYVNEALTIKRVRTRARGQMDRVRKRACHITVAVSDE